MNIKKAISMLFMQARVDEWTKKAFEASVEDFLALIEEAKGVLEEEKNREPEAAWFAYLLKQ